VDADRRHRDTAEPAETLLALAITRRLVDEFASGARRPAAGRCVSTS
jgi:hypothetical protein